MIMMLKVSKALVQVLINGNSESSNHFPMAKISFEHLQESGYGLGECMIALLEASGDVDIVLHKLFMKW